MKFDELDKLLDEMRLDEPDCIRNRLIEALRESYYEMMRLADVVSCADLDVIMEASDRVLAILRGDQVNERTTTVTGK